MFSSTSRHGRFSATSFRARRRNKIEFESKTLAEFLHKYSAQDYLSKNNEDLTKRAKLLAELAHVLQLCDYDDEIPFAEVFEWATISCFEDDSRIRTLSLHIACLLPMTDGRFALILEAFSATLLRGLHLVELPETECIECMKLVSNLLDYYYNASETFRKFFGTDERFLLFFRSALQGAHSLALEEHTPPQLATQFKSANIGNENISSHSAHKFRFAGALLFLEAAVRAPFFVIEWFGSSWITKFFETFYNHNSRIAFIMHQTLAKWMDSPRLRDTAELHLVLQKISAPLIEVGLFQRQIRELSGLALQRMKDSFENPAQTVLDILQTWSGLFACVATNPDVRFHEASPLRIIPLFGSNELSNVNSLKLRDVIVDTCCEFVNVPYAGKHFSDWNEALSFYFEMHLPDEFNSSLRNDFVVEEMTNLMCSDELRDGELNLLRCFHVIAAYAAIESGIIEAICGAIVACPDDPMSIKATLLLSDLMRLGTTYLPHECQLRLAAIPELIRSTTENFWEHNAPMFAAYIGRATSPHRRTVCDKLSSVIIGDRLLTNSSFPLSISSHFSKVVRGVHDADSSDIFSTDGSHVENSFVLFHRLSQLTELARLRDSSTLMAQLRNINIFLLNASNAEIDPSEEKIFKSIASSNVTASALEQCLLDTSSKLFLSNEMTNLHSPTSFSPADGMATTSLKYDDEKMIGLILQQYEQQKKLVPINWRFVDLVLQTLEATSQPIFVETLQKSSKLLKKCHTFFTAVCNQFLPSRQLFLQKVVERTKFDTLYTMNCGQRAYKFVTEQVDQAAMLYKQNNWVPKTTANFHATISVFYLDLLRTFAADFAAQLNDINGCTGTFAPKNLLDSDVLYYFAIFRVICQQESGFKIFEKAGVLQIFYELVANRPELIEYIKLILSSLDYTRHGIARVILETAAASSEKKIRKWTTRFLNILAGLSQKLSDNEKNKRHNTNEEKSLADVSVLALRLAVRQLSDESPKVVRLAINVLLNWLPRQRQHLGLLESVDLKQYGNAGRLLEGVYIGLSENIENSQRANVLDFWLKEFNECYVDVIDEQMRRLNLNLARSIDGDFARPSHIPPGHRSVYPPPHFLGQLARHAVGRAFLASYRVVQTLLTRLRDFRRQNWPRNQSERQTLKDNLKYTTDELDCRAAKATLFAAAHIIAAFNYEIYGDICSLFRQTLLVIVDFATSCSWLSVRGCAIWALNIAGQGRLGGELLEELGWECGMRRSARINKTLNAKIQCRLAQFACGDFYLNASGVHRQKCRRRSKSWDFASMSTDFFGGNFLRRTVSQPNCLFDGIEKPIVPQTSIVATTTVASLNCPLFLREKYEFISDTEETSLISYRKLLMSNGETNVFDLSCNKTVTMKSKRRSPILYLPPRIASICSNVFTNCRWTAHLPFLPASKKNFGAHKSLNCLFCASRSYRREKVDAEIEEAYQRYGADVLRLLHCLQVRLTELNGASHNNNNKSNKKHDSATPKVREDVTQSSIALKLQMSLLRIYVESSKTFLHPCLFSDALYAMAEFRLNAVNRRFIHQLFASARL